MSSTTLSRGRTKITRTHANIGNVVHEACECVEYVHLCVLNGVSLDESTADAVVVNQNENVRLRVVIGEDDSALYFNFNLNAENEVHLANNLCVNPYEKIYISTSNPQANVVINGVVTRKPVLV